MKTKLVLLVALTAILTVSCMMARTVNGSGNVVTEERDAGGFQQVSFALMGRMVLRPGDTESVTITADDNIMRLIEAEVRDGVLHVGRTSEAGMAQLRPSEEIVYEVTYRELSGLSLSGSGSMDLAGLETPFLELSLSGSGAVIVKGLEGGQIRTSISGSGAINLSGTADSHSLDLSGSGTYRTGELVSRDARLTISGSGTAVVNATETLSVMLSGSGVVRYMGDPDLTESVSGSGAIQRIEKKVTL